MMNFIFSKRLKELRMKNSLTLKKMGQDLKLSSSILCYYEKGDKMPSNKTLIKIAKYFKVSSDYLLGMDYILETKEETYLKDNTLLKIIRRTPKLANFILDDPRTNVKILENFIDNINN